MRKYSQLLLYLVILGLPWLFFYKIFLGNIIAVGDFTGSDLLDLHYPFKHVLHQAVTSGKLPLWEKNLALGYPLFAEGQSGVLFPLNLILAFLNPADAINFSLIAAILLAIFGTYHYLRLLGKSLPEALFAGCVFAFSAFFITRIKHLNLINTAALFPYLLIFTKQFFKKQKFIYAIPTSIVVASMVLAGHPQMAFYNLLIFLLYAAFEIYRSYTQNRREAAAISLGITFMTVSLLVGLLLSAVQILPTLEMAGLSSRSDLSREALLAYPFHPKNLITFISPFYFGNPATATYLPDIRSFGIFWENSSYIGMLPFLLAIVAIIRIFLRRDQNPYHKFYVVLAGISLFLMLGPFTPLFPALIDNLPLLNLFRFPTRFNLYLIFSLAILGGSGFTYLINKIDHLRSKLGSNMPKTPGNAEEYHFNWPLTRRQTSILLIGITLLDLYVFAKAYIGYLPKSQLLQKSSLTDKMLQDVTYYRFYNTTQYLDSPYQALGWVQDPQALLTSRKSLPPNNNLLLNLPSFTDRTWFEGGLGVAKRNEIESYLLYENSDQVLTGKILGMYSVKYILSFSDYLGIEIYKEDELDLGPPYASSLKLFRNDQVLPRVYVVPEAQYLTSDREVLEKIKSSEFLPTKTVLLEDQPQNLPAEFKGALTKYKEDNQVEINSDTNTQIRLTARLKQPGFLVLNDIYYPGWEAEVDGQSQPILKANYLVRSLELGPGDHQVVFKFAPLSFKIGRLISGLTLLGLLLILTRYFYLQIRQR